MAESWRIAKLGDVLTLHRGFDLPNNKRREGAIPVVSSSGITGYHSESKVKGPGVVTGRYGTLGEVYYVPQDFWPLNTTLFVSDFKGNNPRFASYFLKHLELGRYSGASAVPGIDRNVVHRIQVRIPSLLTQSKIGQILGSFDDLINNNVRRIKVLEEIARAAFAERFVKVLSRGQEQRMQKSSNTQAVPIGWRIEPIGRAFRTVLGGTPSRAETKYWKYGDIPWINSSKVNEVRIIDETEFITRLGLENSSAKLMPKRTTVIAITGATLGQVSLLEIEACANQSVVGVFDEEGRYPEYIFLAIKHNIEDIISRASGGAQQHINKEVINAYPIIIPPKTIVDNFNEFVRPIFDLVRALALKNSVLRQARDLLLPRLISGELDLSDLDIAGDDDNS